MRPRSRSLATMALALILGLGAAACASSTSATTPEGTNATPAGGSTSAGAPFAITRTTVTLDDPTRPTEAGTRTPEHPGRSLVTDVYVPEGPGPFPLVVFAHGVGGNPDKVVGLLSAWAKAGYVVAAPAFPVTNDSVPGAGENWRNVAAQPGDVSFVLDTLLGTGGDAAGLRTLDADLDAGAGPPLPERVDPDRVGVSGHSLGGATAYGVAFNPCCRDPRVKAVEILSGLELPVGVPAGGEFQLDGHLPLLIMHGDQDGTVGYHLAPDVYASARPPVWFVTLVGANHAPPYEDAPSKWDDAVTTITTDFWDATIGNVPGAMSRFEADAVLPGLTTLQKKPS
jgi:dienelactone hydrolase